MSGNDPEETTPFTHRPYGSSSDDQPPSPPPSTPPEPPSWPTYQQPQSPPYSQAPTGPYGQVPYGQPPQGQSAYGHSPYVGGMPHPQANTALVLGIVALAGTFVCIVPCVVGPFAWAMGARVRREIDADPQRWSGRAEATVGYVTGIVATMLLLLGVLGFLFFFVILAAALP